ncbi:MAG: peptidoglycan DD-metalloendopeptidase family protein [Firmicutes bacterium]|nr:peptidoglycan DD-metalloendopeptidase family protein [Bacillota bacterium]MCM1401145.1 peptidoglycan DD-metalloendopeptidase family protein [Bacteroides sp.]
MHSSQTSLSHTIQKILLTMAMALVVTCITIPVQSASRKRNINSVKREQKAAEKSIKENTRRLNDNVRKTEQNLQKLNQLESDLTEKTQQVSAMQGELSAINGHIKTASDSLQTLSANLSKLKSEYAQALRKMQGSYRDTNILSFIFSSKNFKEAAARYRYISEFSQWRKRKLEEIDNASKSVNKQRNKLGALQISRKETLTSLSGSETRLREMRDEADRVVAQLKKEGSALQAAINKNQQRLKSLDKELDRLIIAEQKRQEELRKAEEKRKAEQKAREAAKKAKEKNKATAKTKNSKPEPKQQAPTQQQTGLAEADRTLSGSFESNKGRLLFPVRGKYTVVRGFGRQRHPDLPNVVTDNSGIDIAATPGSKARCIFQGTVSGVFSQDGFNKVVMVRHGNYISIYANLASINVKVGDKVKANQDIGTINADSQYGNKPVLHFELRKERNKLNPLQWVK